MLSNPVPSPSCTAVALTNRAPRRDHRIRGHFPSGGNGPSGRTLEKNARPIRFRRSMRAALIQSSAALLYCPVCTIARISSSVKRHHLLGRPERVVGQAIHKWRERLDRFPRERVERLALECADLREIGILGFHPRRRGDAKARDVAPDGAFPRDGRFVPFPRQLRSILNATAKRSGEVNQVVTNPANRRRRF